MYLDGRSLMHIVDKDTLYSAATFCHGGAIEDLWKQYLTTRVHPYVGHPQVMHTDQAPQFKSLTWKALTDSANTTLVLSKIESHNALGVGERYHTFLRFIYRKIRLAHPELSQKMALGMATAAMNQTAGPRGLVPTLLIFRVIPRIPVTPLSLPGERDRAQAMATACKEMTAQMARVRVRSALADGVPAAADCDFQPSTQVLVYRESPVDQWERPFTAVVNIDKIVWLAIDGQLKPFGVDKVKPHVAMRVHDAVPAQLPVNDDDAGARTAAGTAIEAGDGQATAADRSNAPWRGQEHQANAQAPVPAMDVCASPREGAKNPDYKRMLDAVISGEGFLST
eukprot:contig_27732_g6828